MCKKTKIINPIYLTPSLAMSARGGFYRGTHEDCKTHLRVYSYNFICSTIGIRICLKKLK